MHLHRRQFAQDFRCFFELDPVELDVGARRKVAVTAVVFTRDGAEHAQLVAAQVAVRNRDAVHVRVTLHVQAVLQAQRPEFLFAQLARQTPAHLVAVLSDAFVDDFLVDLIVLIHSGAPVFSSSASTAS